MKKKLLLIICLIISYSIQSQEKITGPINIFGDITFELILNNNTETAQMIISGPEDRWFAVKIGSFTNGMETGSDVYYYNGTTLIDAHQLSNGPAIDAVQDITIESSTVENGIRTIIATRPFDTGDSNDYIIDFDNEDIDMAAAHGSFEGYTLSYHGSNREKINNVPMNSLGINNMSLKTVKLYPNPTKDILFFESTIVIKNVLVYSQTGKLIRQIQLKNNAQSIEIQDFEKGIYLLQLNGENESAWKKIIVE